MMSWGLRFPDQYPRIHPGWMQCRSVYREDTIPSAGFDAYTGVYNEFGGGGERKTLSLFDLAVELKAFRTWQEAFQFLSAKYLR